MLKLHEIKKRLKYLGLFLLINNHNFNSMEATNNSPLSDQDLDYDQDWFAEPNNKCNLNNNNFFNPYEESENEEDEKSENDLNKNEESGNEEDEKSENNLNENEIEPNIIQFKNNIAKNEKPNKEKPKLKKKLQKIITDHELLLTNNDLTKELNSLNSIKNPEQKNKRKKDLNHSLQETPEYIAAGDIYRLKNRLTSTNFFKALDEFGISDQYKENLKLLFSIIFYEYKQTNNSNRDVISKIQQEIEYENKLPKNKEKDKKIQEKISICNKKIEKYLKSVSYKNVRIFKETLFNIIYETYNSLQRIPKKNKKERSNIERSKLEAKIIEKFKSDEDCTKILTRLYKILIRNNITKKILTIYHEDVYIEIPYDNDNKITLDAVKLMYLLAVKQCIQKINQKNK